MLAELFISEVKPRVP